MTILSSILPDFVGFTLKTVVFQLQFTRRIGTGAYGTVYLAHDLTSTTICPATYAVKCMLKFEAGSELEAMQQREIAYHRSLNHHPNVTKLHCVVEEQYYIFLVMDYYEGGDLFGAVIDRQSFSGNSARVKLGFVQLLDAVEACHEQGIFHRDLKPENILCSSGDSRFFLSDFGLATETEMSSSFRCGSSFYMSPECIGTPNQPTPYSTRQSDIWSLGVILVNLISGRNPWRIASREDEGYSMYLDNSADFLRHILPIISSEASSILTRIFDPNPATRVTIPELRRLILSTSTFFSHDEEYAEGLKLITETFPESRMGEAAVAVLDVNIRTQDSDATASTAAFFSVFISTPTAEVASNDYFGGIYDPPTLDGACAYQHVTPATYVNAPPTYAHTAQAAANQDAVLGANADMRTGGFGEVKVARTVHRIMDIFRRRTAWT